MARRVRVVEIVIDDLTGIELPEGVGERFEYNFDGASYEIDLGPENAEGFRQLMAPLIDKSRRISGRRRHLPKGEKTTEKAVERPQEPRAIPAGANGEFTEYQQMMEERRFRKEIRKWARENGFPDQADTGKLRPGVRDEWNKAHPDRPAPDERPSEFYA